MADKLGPGTLTFGETATASEWGAQCTNVTLEPKTDEGDELVFLSGDRDSDATTDWTLSGKIAQTFDRKSLLIWAKDNAGKKLPFTFKPRNDGEVVLKGSVIVRPVAFGGDTNKKNTSDFEFKCVGQPQHSFQTVTAPGT